MADWRVVLYPGCFPPSRAAPPCRGQSAGAGFLPLRRLAGAWVSPGSSWRKEAAPGLQPWTVRQFPCGAGRMIMVLIGNDTAAGKSLDLFSRDCQNDSGSGGWTGIFEPRRHRGKAGEHRERQKIRFQAHPNDFSSVTSCLSSVPPWSSWPEPPGRFPIRLPAAPGNPPNHPLPPGLTSP